MSNDYSNIQRIIIRKPVGLREAMEAYKILAELNKQIEIVKTMADREVLPEIIIDHMMINIDAGIERVAQLSGFANEDDMKYWVENFKYL